MPLHRPRGTYKVSGARQVWLAAHAWAAVKRLAIAEKRPIVDIVTEFVDEGLARKLGLDPASIPKRHL
jgi:hypothetical protein